MNTTSAPAARSAAAPRPSSNARAALPATLQVHSTVVRSEKPNKGLEVLLSANPNQMHRLIGYLPDGKKVMIAQRFGRGGMDINKVAGGKVFAVAADALSPVMEKDKDGKATKVQKVEDGLPLFSSSGFYLLSSKDYPALDILTGHSHLFDDGNKVLLCTEDQLAATALMELSSELDFEMLEACLQDMLSDERNLVVRFNESINTRRRRGIERAQQEAEDEGEVATVVEFAELPVSVKDGNACVMLSWRLSPQAPLQTMAVMREAVVANEDYDDGRVLTRYFTPEQAVEFFRNGPEGRGMREALEAGQPLKVCITPAHVMRTSVSFRRKVANVQAAPPEKNVFGEAVYIQAALKGWVPAICALMYSQHPTFPALDYDSNHYVAAPRQKEISMTRREDNTWTPPQAPVMAFAALQARALKPA